MKNIQKRDRFYFDSEKKFNCSKIMCRNQMFKKKDFCLKLIWTSYLRGVKSNSIDADLPRFTLHGLWSSDSGHGKTRTSWMLQLPNKRCLCIENIV